MLKLTIDTNCLINLFDDDQIGELSYDDLAELVRYSLAGKLSIYITTRAEVDLSSDKDADRKSKFYSILQLFPVIGSVGRFSISKWGSGDSFSGLESRELLDEIQKIVFPGLSKNDKRYKNKQADIEHLLSHSKNGNDIFVTNDKGILKCQEELRRSLSIIVMAPQVCVHYVRETQENALREHDRNQEINEIYRARADSGVFEFDYSNNDGRFLIGCGDFEFLTQWGRCAKDAIYAYSDEPRERFVAEYRAEENPISVKDAESQDFSSRVRTINIGAIAIWKNSHGNYCATKVVEIDDRRRGDAFDRVRIEYRTIR